VTNPRTRHLVEVLAALLALAVVSSVVGVTTASHAQHRTAQPRAAQHRRASTAPVPARRTAALPAVKHVFVVVIENKSFERAWGADSPATYLSRTLRSRGVLLDHYYGTAHNSLGNYLAMISGQGPDAEIQADCHVFSDFARTGTVAPQQEVGSGCVFPRRTRTLPRQLTGAGLSWRGYMDGMGSACRHPRIGTRDRTQAAEVGDQYATRHDPFMYFHSIIDRRTSCRRHVVDLSHLPADLEHASSTPTLSFVVPDLCHDGHDEPCVDGRPGGMVTVDAWMKRWMPRILRSPAFQDGGALIVTSDESDGAHSDSTACCGEGPGPNAPAPGITGMGGGRVGALVVSPFTEPGTRSSTPYNHYALLASLEDLFGLPRIGYARQGGLDTFGTDVWSHAS
jgi:phospholipase C